MNTFSATWRIELMGRLRASSSAETIDRFPTQKTAALLARLAFPPSRRYQREDIAGMLWEDADIAAARDRLSQALGWLRSHLEPEGVVRGSVLDTDRLAIGFATDAITTDVGDFEAALARAKQATPPQGRKDALVQAVTLYSGDLLPDHYQDWVITERQRLQNAYADALRDLAGLQEQEGDYTAALGYARRALTVDALDEETHAAVLRLLGASGQTTAALRHFEEWKATLKRELSAEPSPRVQAMVTALRTVAPPSLVPSPTATRFVAPPTPLTRFFGRDDEIRQLCAMVREERARLVTITGIGGAGKTRILLAASRELASPFADAMVFVPAADLDDARMLPVALAAALHLPKTDSANLLGQITAAIGTGPFLLILDNLEHLQAGAALFVRELLDRLPMLTVLATSRQRLGVEGEREMSLSPLPIPAQEADSDAITASPSVQLFADRARAVRPDFAITPANAATIARLCERLDGIPLAIELCAAWAQTLTPSQMLEKLAQRFDLLVSRRSDIPPRHRTLRAALEYSYLLLPTELRHLFTRLSVFRGGWDLDAADICVDLPEYGSLSLLADLTELRERSLIVADEEPAGDGEFRMRYRMLETLREFAGKQLSYAERMALRQAHATYFAELAEQAEPHLAGADQERWLSRLDAEQENIRAAFAWCREADEIALGLRLGGALRRYWWIRGYLEEGYQWLRPLLDKAATMPFLPPDIAGKAWTALGLITWSQGDYAAARSAHAEGLALRRTVGDKTAIAESLYHLGITAYRQDDHPGAQAYLRESLALSQEQSDAAGIARVLLNLGNIAYEQKSYPEARAYFSESLSLEQTLGNRQRVADSLTNLGVLALAEQDYEQATTYLQDALVIHRKLGNHYATATVLVNFGEASRLLGNYATARSLFTEGLQMARDIGNKHIIAHYLLQMGILKAAEKQIVRSVTLIAAAQHLFAQMASTMRGNHDSGHQEALAAARVALGNASFEAAWERGCTLSLAQSIDYALAVENP